MSNKEILEQAISKAINGGWTSPLFPEWSVEELVKRGEYDIFNHDFAKALWGDKEHVEQQGYDGMNCYNCDADQSKYIDRCWEAHLQAMVIADDPIKYLRENI